MDASNRTAASFRWRAFISVMTGVSFLGLALSGIILFVSPVGRIANWTGWRLIGLGKHEWGGVHIWLGFTFIAVSLCHLILNWRAMLNYLKRRASQRLGFRWEWAAALLLCVLVVAGTISDVPPFSSLLSWNDGIKQRWTPPPVNPPIPHAELMTLAAIAERTPGLDVDQMVIALTSQGIEGVLPESVLGRLAAAQGITPSELYALAVDMEGRCAQEASTGEAAEPDPASHARMGMGRMTIEAYCRSMGIDLDHALQKLLAAGHEATPDMRLRDVAQMAQCRPSDVPAMLR